MWKFSLFLFYFVIATVLPGNGLADNAKKKKSQKQNGSVADVDKARLIDAYDEVMAAIMALQAKPFDCDPLPGLPGRVEQPRKIFRDVRPLNLILQADFKGLFAGYDKGRKIPGEIFYITNDGGKKKISVDFAVRGNSKQNLCRDFKPYRIIFREKQEDNPFHGLSGDLKVGSHCVGRGKVDDESEDTQQLLREYTAYQVLNASGLMSLKPRLANVTYKDLQGNTVAEAKAMILEPKSEMARRFGMKLDKSYANQPLGPELIPYDLTVQFLVHQDKDKWRHNTFKMVAKDGTGRAGALYDFDLLGIVLDDAGTYGKRIGYRAWNEANTDDTAWLKNYASKAPRGVDARIWKENVIKYAKRMLQHEADVDAVIKTSPAKDMSVFTRRKDKFYKGLREFLEAEEPGYGL